MKCLKTAGKVSVAFYDCQLLTGAYDVDVTIENAVGDTIDYFEKAVSLEIDSRKKCSGVAWLDHAWNLDE